MSEQRSRHRQIRRAATAALASALALAGSMLAAGTAGASVPRQAGEDPPVQAAVAPGFTKAFASDTILPGGTSTLTFTIDNTANATDTTGLLFTDAFPTGVTVAATPAAGTTCTDPGAATPFAPAAGATSITFTGWTVNASSSCTVFVDVTSSTPGSHVNTSSVLESVEEPDTGTATDTLIVDGLPTFAKAFDLAQIDPGGVSTLTFTIDNTANVLDATALDFTDTLPVSPAAMVVATPANASTDCTSGTLTATDGAASITYTSGSVAAGASCTVSVDVTATDVGTYANTSGALTSDHGDSGTATASLGVTPIFLSKTFLEGSIVPGGTATFEVVVRNDGTEDLANIVLTDALVTSCDRTFTTLAVDAAETFTCTLESVGSGFTNTVVATADGATSGLAFDALATADVVVTEVPATTTVPPGPALALTGGPKTGLLAAIGLASLLFGSVLLLGSWQRRRLARR